VSLVVRRHPQVGGENLTLSRRRDFLTADHAEYADFSSSIPRGAVIVPDAVAQPGSRRVGTDLTGDFLSILSMLPNQIAAPNRRLRLGLVPWSFEFSKSQGSAVGELRRSAGSTR